MLLGHTFHRSHRTMLNQALSHLGWEIFLMRVFWVIGYNGEFGL